MRYEYLEAILIELFQSKVIIFCQVQLQQRLHLSNCNLWERPNTVFSKPGSKGEVHLVASGIISFNEWRKNKAFTIVILLQQQLQICPFIVVMQHLVQFNCQVLGFMQIRTIQRFPQQLQWSTKQCHNLVLLYKRKGVLTIVHYGLSCFAILQKFILMRLDEFSKMLNIYI